MEVLHYIDDYISGYQPYKSYWNYEDGCVLMGCLQMYSATGDRKYFDFIVNYLDPLISHEGTIRNYETNLHNIDSFNSGKVLFAVYEKTGEDKYKKAIDFLMDRLGNHPRTECGNFWHKSIYPNQIWLDGLYMALPFYMEYETKYNGKENYSDIIRQFENVRHLMFDSKKALYYHAFDESRIQPWADKVTGLSPNFWLRSMGWYLMALIDVMDAMSIEIFEKYKMLEGIFIEAVKGILMYRDKKTGLFFQVIDQSDAEGNYTEASGSAMIAYAILKACRIGILSEERYLPFGMDILDSLCRNKLQDIDGKVSLTGICRVAGLGPGEERDGSVAYYLSEKVVSDDPKGVGPFMMAYAQRLMLQNIT